MVDVIEHPDWLRAASYQGSPIREALRVHAYQYAPEAADAVHQARMQPYRSRIFRMQQAEANERARRQGLLASPRVQW
jgi:hypothetical protein